MKVEQLQAMTQVELTAKVEESVARLDVWEEGIAQALSLGRALYQASDVSHIQEGWHFAGTNKQHIIASS